MSVKPQKSLVVDHLESSRLEVDRMAKYIVLPPNLRSLLHNIERELKKSNQSIIRNLRKSNFKLYGKIQYFQQVTGYTIEELLSNFSIKFTSVGRKPMEERFNINGEITERACNLCSNDNGLLPISKFEWKSTERCYRPVCYDCRQIENILSFIKHNDTRLLNKDFTKEYVYNLYHHTQKRLCFFTKTEMDIRGNGGTVFSADRVLNDDREYAKSKVVLCIKWFNSLKSDFDLDELYKLLLISVNNFKDMKRIIRRMAHLDSYTLSDEDLYHCLTNAIEGIEILRKHNYNTVSAIKDRFQL